MNGFPETWNGASRPRDIAGEQEDRLVIKTLESF